MKRSLSFGMVWKTGCSISGFELCLLRSRRGDAGELSAIPESMLMIFPAEKAPRGDDSSLRVSGDSEREPWSAHSQKKSLRVVGR